MVHIILGGYTGAAERRPRRDARLLHTGTTLFRSVPLSRLRSPSSLPTHLFHHLATTLPSLSRPLPLSALLTLLPLSVSFSLYTVPRTFSVSLSPSRLFLAVLATWPLASASSISFIDIGRPPSFSPPSRSYSSLVVLTPLPSFSAFHPSSSRRSSFPSTRSTLDRAFPLVLHPLYSTLSQSRSRQSSMYPTSTLTETPARLLLFPLVSTSCSLSTLSSSSVSFVAALPMFVPFSCIPCAHPSPFTPQPAKNPPLPPPAPVCPDTRHYHVHPTFLFVSLENSSPSSARARWW